MYNCNDCHSKKECVFRRKDLKCRILIDEPKECHFIKSKQDVRKMMSEVKMEKQERAYWESLIAKCQ